MSNFLAEIYQHKLAELALRKKQISFTELRLRAIEFQKNFPLQKSRNFFEVLKAKNDAKETAIICEIKRGSPSAGMIRPNPTDFGQKFDAQSNLKSERSPIPAIAGFLDTSKQNSLQDSSCFEASFNPGEIAKIYEQAGAACLSVLTEERYFLGNDDYLRQARAVSNLPILRKDFMIDPYQILESKLLGADCILLIVALLDDEKLAELEELAFELNLSVLIEIHDENELKRALKLNSKLLGINNRNLKTLKTDLKNSLNLLPLIPKEYVLVSESGIKSVEDIRLLKQADINCFLIGEHFMRQENIALEVRKLIS